MKYDSAVRSRYWPANDEQASPVHKRLRNHYRSRELARPDHHQIRTTEPTCQLWPITYLQGALTEVPSYLVEVLKKYCAARNDPRPRCATNLWTRSNVLGPGPQSTKVASFLSAEGDRLVAGVFMFGDDHQIVIVQDPPGRWRHGSAQLVIQNGGHNWAIWNGQVREQDISPVDCCVKRILEESSAASDLSSLWPRGQSPELEITNSSLPWSERSRRHRQEYVPGVNPSSTSNRGRFESTTKSPSETVKAATPNGQISIDQIDFVFRDSIGDTVRRRSIVECADIKKLFLQARVARINDKGHETLQASFPDYNQLRALYIVEGDQQDFDTMLEMAMKLQSMEIVITRSDLEDQRL